MPKGLVKTDNLQVNYVTGRTENSLCIALMNECDRELKEVTVQIDETRFKGQTLDGLKVRIWRDNQLQAHPVRLVKGGIKVSISPKGITSLVITGLTPKAEFQDKFNALPASPETVTHKRIQTPFGDAQGMMVSFGSDLTWLYAYLTADEGIVKSARLKVELLDRTETLTDDTFPFEFSLPLKAGETALKLTVEAVDPAGSPQTSKPFQLSQRP